MTCRDASVVVVVVVLAGAFSFALVVIPDEARAVTHFVGGAGPGNFSAIQDAIDYSFPGDTVYVYSGTYNEKVVVSHSLDLIGEDEASTIVVGSGYGDVIQVTADSVRVSGFTAIGGEVGIELDYVQNCHVDNNTMHSNIYVGISIYHSHNVTVENVSAYWNNWSGIMLYGSVDVTVMNNTVWNNGDGIWLQYSYDNVFANNHAFTNTWSGIDIISSKGNKLTSNVITDGGVLIEWDPTIDPLDQLEYWNTHEIDTTNSVNGRPVHYLKNVTGGKVPGGAGQVILANSTGVTVENQNVSDGTTGIHLAYSSNNTIANNTVSFGKQDGVIVHRSSGNIIENNTISHNHGRGVFVLYSDGNLINENILESNGREGVYMYSNGHIITGNKISSNSEGLWVSGSKHIISSNDVTLNNEHGIWIHGSDITVSGNTVSYSPFGILIDRTTAATVLNNVMVEDGIYVDGDYLEYWNTHVIDTTNTVNGKPVYYWKNLTGGSLPPDAGEVILANCTAVNIDGHDLNNGSVGIELGYSSGNAVSNVTVSSNNVKGIYLWRSDNNLILDSEVSNGGDGVSLGDSDGNMISGNIVFLNTGIGVLVKWGLDNVMDGNTMHSNGIGVEFLWTNDNALIGNDVDSNSRTGLYVHNSDANLVRMNNFLNNGEGANLSYSSCDNVVYHNNFLDNTIQSIDGSNNSWDNGYEFGGNYWSNYTGADDRHGPNQDQPGSDSIGDTPYIIDADSRDRYPLVFPYGAFLPEPPAYLNAILSGEGLGNVTIEWAPSVDDGGGRGSVRSYRVFRGSTYDPAGIGYELVDTIPNGTSIYLDSFAGEGDPSNYFYIVCAVDYQNLSSCADNQVAKFTRKLSPGSNLVSVPLIQSDWLIENVLQTVSFDNTWAYDSSASKWTWYTTSKPYVGKMRSVDHTKGFWIDVQGPYNLTVAGIVPWSTTIQLNAGWNLVGFPSFATTYTAGDLRAETGAKRVEAFDPPSPPYSLKSFSDGDVLVAGCGYWIFVETDVDWTVTNA